MREFTSEEFLTVAEVADRLKLNQQTIRNWIEAGRLPAVRVSRRVRVLGSDFERLVAHDYRDAVEPAPAERNGPSASGFWDGSWVAVPQIPH